MQEPIYNNGTVKVAKEGVSAYLAWYRTLSMADAKEISDVCSRLTKEAAKNAGVDLYDIGRNTFSFFGHQTEGELGEAESIGFRKNASFFHFAEEFEQPIRAALWSKEAAFLYIGNPQKGIIVMEPEKYMTYTPDRDYSDLTPAQAMAELGSAAVCDMSIIPVGAGTALSQKTVKEQLSTHQTEIEKLKSEMKDVEGAKTGELAELTAQIEALKQELWQKKDKLMAELNRKMEEMEEKKEQLEGQIYLLDSQIYAIRCYAGEVVNFTRIRSGKNAPDTEPIVVHQKLRFLDEDLGRLASLYEIQWNELDMFESFLKHSPYALDTFAPNERCIMLVRLSRTGKSIGRAMDNEGRPYHNMLDRYDYYHGKTVGIIIRNGENLYLGWTDENRVHISDDLILTRAQVVTETVPEEPKEFIFESERKRYVKEQREQRKRILDGLVSRTFVYNILQGVVDTPHCSRCRRALRLPNSRSMSSSPLRISGFQTISTAPLRISSLDAIRKSNREICCLRHSILFLKRTAPLSIREHGRMCVDAASVIAHMTVLWMIVRYIKRIWSNMTRRLRWWNLNAQMRCSKVRQKRNTSSRKRAKSFSGTIRQSRSAMCSCPLKRAANGIGTVQAPQMPVRISSYTMASIST